MTQKKTKDKIVKKCTKKPKVYRKEKSKEVEELKELVGETTSFDAEGKELFELIQEQEQKQEVEFHSGEEYKIPVNNFEPTHSLSDALSAITKYAEILDELNNKKSITKDQPEPALDVKKVSRDFIDYCNSNVEYIKNIIKYYKGIVEKRNKFISLLKCESPALEKQIDFFMEMACEYESANEDLILSTLPKENGPFIKDAFGPEYHSGDKTKSSRATWLEGLTGNFRRKL